MYFPECFFLQTILLAVLSKCVLYHKKSPSYFIIWDLFNIIMDLWFCLVTFVSQEICLLYSQSLVSGNTQTNFFLNEPYLHKTATVPDHAYNHLNNFERSYFSCNLHLFL